MHFGFVSKLFSGKTAKPRALYRRSARGSVRYSIIRSDVGGLDISSNLVKVAAKERLREIIRSEDFKNYARHEKLLRDQFTYHVTGKFKFQDIANPLRISFENLNLKLKVNNATVLEGLFGVIRPYNVTALMGPSGAGVDILFASLRFAITFILQGRCESTLLHSSLVWFLHPFTYLLFNLSVHMQCKHIFVFFLPDMCL